MKLIKGWYDVQTPVLGSMRRSSERVVRRQAGVLLPVKIRDGIQTDDQAK